MKVYFPNLNSLRFFAAILVVVHHIEQYKEVFGLPNLFHQPNIQLMSKIGVTLFFSLSGFLITYLLLIEQQETNTINIKNFYARRILRIWPLYYLIVFLAFFILPHVSPLHLPGHDGSHFFIKMVFFVFMLPNIIHALGAGLAYATQSWSIGAEEQFYLLWPWLLKFFKNKLTMVLLVILGYTALRICFEFLFFKHIAFAYMSRIWYLFPIDNMAFGALFAIVHFNNYVELKTILFHKLFQWIIWLIVILLILSGHSLGYFHHQIYAILFGILIINLAINPQSVVKFNWPVLDYLGKISYGIYMYHAIFIVISIKLLELLHTQNNYLLYLLSFVMTLIISAISYELLEKYFIKKKAKYSEILSGDNVL